ncbi:MAG: GT4 family glycosyltransferase PelF [Hyphomicrobiaceae bacterium]|nr:GT4 family glycosyltransferase PelF [Hyphomicrobiaceae bacterium]
MTGALTETTGRETDVCILVEGCYPYVPGGVSGWIDWLIRSQTGTSFQIVALWPKPTTQPPRYALPPNVVALHHLYLQDFGAEPVKRLRLPDGLDELAAALGELMGRGGRGALARVDQAVRRTRGRLPLPVLFNSPVAWEIARQGYGADMPYGSFLHYFWAWRALLGGLLATLEFPLPKARVYHTISTGYAGVLAARAALETGRPTLLTEHGIYTNERRIELLMADWVADTVDKGHAIDDPRFDLRDMWVRAFEAYARTCYECVTEVITLYEDNQRAQRLLGAPLQSLRVVANGIDLKRFAGLRQAGDRDRPTVALIGRVVPIKDVKTFISAAALLRTRIPDVHALILGPTDEDADYFDECAALVASLGLEGTVEFTGTVNIVEYMSRIHVVALTSLSESQPLVILEAGAAGIPFVATNVGSCREILEGRPDETPALGPGGIVTGLVAPGEVAAALESLLTDHARRRRYGDTLRERVKRVYTAEKAADAYRGLYRQYIEAPTHGVPRPAA